MPDPKFRLEGLLKHTGEWVAVHTYDTIEKAREAKSRVRFRDGGWIDQADYSIKREDFAAWRIQDVFTVHWGVDNTI